MALIRDNKFFYFFFYIFSPLNFTHEFFGAFNSHSVSQVKRFELSLRSSLGPSLLLLSLGSGCLLLSTGVCYWPCFLLALQEAAVEEEEEEKEEEGALLEAIAACLHQTAGPTRPRPTLQPLRASCLASNGQAQVQFYLLKMGTRLA